MDQNISLEEITCNEGIVKKYVRNLSLFSDLDESEFAQLARWFRVYTAKAGEFVFKEGDQSSQLCLVAEGLITIYKQINEAELFQVAQIKEGGSIGEMGVLEDKPISATAIASVNSVVFIISADNFNRLITENEKMGVKLLKKIGQIISARLRKTTAMLAEVSIAKSDVS
ncbi:MAG: CRP-like cAMP-binding protein [Gammaproteobacteria bacterium]|jgi:CRP-like cAMP-binding protein